MQSCSQLFSLVAPTSLRGGPPRERDTAEALSAKRGRVASPTAGMLFGLRSGVILEDLQIGDRVGKRVAESRFHAAGRKGVQLFAMRLGKLQFGFPDPGLRNSEIISDRHRQFVHRRLVLVSGRKS